MIIVSELSFLEDFFVLPLCICDSAYSLSHKRARTHAHLILTLRTSHFYSCLAQVVGNGRLERKSRQSGKSVEKGTASFRTHH